LFAQNNNYEENKMTWNPLKQIARLRVRTLIERLTYAKASRCAFTLTEVLIAVAGIGIMFSLLAPTVQKKQEAENIIPEIVAISVLETDIEVADLP